jgi:hypothetical protein
MTKRHFLDPLREYLSKWLDAKPLTSQLDPSISLELELLQTSLSRVDEVLKTLE